jgi:hypothetical protein
VFGPAVNDDGAGPEDHAWYWAALMRLDLGARPEMQRRWWNQADLKDIWRPPVRAKTADEGSQDEAEPTDAWHVHLQEARRVLERAELGRPPADLADVLALMAVAAPGVVALRTLARVTGDLGRCSNLTLRNCAGRVADAWCSYFNAPETQAAVERYCPGEPYWRSAVRFAAQGGLQAVFGEYAHVLVDAAGKRGRPLEDIAAAVSAEMSGALRTRTTNVGVDAIEIDGGQHTVTLHSLPGAFRSRFASRFGVRATTDAAAGERDDVVRRAFNSPFWPLVLCSTSVGQEGLEERRREVAAAIRRALGARAKEWEHEDCDDANEPLGQYLVHIDNRARRDIISSPEKLYDFATTEFPKIFEIADAVGRCVKKALGR